MFGPTHKKPVLQCLSNLSRSTRNKNDPASSMLNISDEDWPTLNDTTDPLEDFMRLASEESNDATNSNCFIAA